ncbi:MAG TPA: DUF1439 domain-containing protein [Ramlibacter sp.]|nr:DUF1439 domain-containing protein [Ramlibacter sp.]
MDRRKSLALIASAVAGLGAVGSASAATPSYRVSLQQLQGAVAQRFPLRYPVAGLFDLSVDTPRLRLLPDLNRVGSEFLLRAAGPALQRSYGGDLDLDFGLRYEPSDRTIRAHHLRVEAIHLEGLAPEAQELLQQSAGDLVRQAMLEVVLHRLRPQDLALADTMGLEPGPITVTWDGLVIGLVNKAPR